MRSGFIQKLGKTGAVGALVALTAAGVPAGSGTTGAPLFCYSADHVDPPAYYAVDLVTTKKLPGTGRTTGVAHVTFSASPFGVALAPDGSYLYDVDLQVTDMKRPTEGVLVAWITTPQVDQVQRLGPLDEALSVRGQVAWNKFLVVVTLEETDDPTASLWGGPIALRGMSRSGMMHTMAGHGPFQQELCAQYGYR